MKVFFSTLIGIIVTIFGAIGLIVLWILDVIAKNIGIVIVALILAYVLIKIFA